MNNSNDVLGGRLALREPTELSGDAKKLFDKISEEMVPWADKTGFQSTDGGRLIGPFNPVLLSPNIGSAFLQLQKEEETSTSLSERVRQIVILSIGSVWKADYELYAHAAAARNAGFSESEIAELSRGEPTSLTDGAERVAQEFTLALAMNRRVDESLYSKAVENFSEKGVLDMIMLAGCYHIVSSMLNAFEIPTPHYDK